MNYSNAAERKAYYLKQAQNARNSAAKATDQTSRDGWFALAAKWQKMAEMTEGRF